MYPNLNEILMLHTFTMAYKMNGSLTPHACFKIAVAIFSCENEGRHFNFTLISLSLAVKICFLDFCVLILNIIGLPTQKL